MRTRFPQIENGDRLQEKCRIEEKSKFGSVLIEFRNWYSSNVLKCIERKCKYFYMQSDHSLSIKEKTVPGWYFASWRDCLIKTTWNIDAFADKQRLWEDWTNWTDFKSAFMILCVWYLNNICISSMLGFHNAIHDYYALKQRPGSEGCWHILSAKTFDFQLSWPHTLLHPPFHIKIFPVWITGPWCKM